MNSKQAADYIHRSLNALKIMRHRRTGPKSFKQGGRIYYYVTELDRWLAEGAASDSRSNPDLDPTLHVAEPRVACRKTVPSTASVRPAA